MYIVNEKQEKVRIDSFDTLEGFKIGDTEVDDFGFAAFVISTITFIAVIAMYFLGQSEESTSSSMSSSSPSSSSFSSANGGSESSPSLASLSNSSLLSASKSGKSKSGKSKSGSGKSGKKSKR